MDPSPRSVVIAGDQDNATLAAVVRALYEGIAWSKARELVAAGKVRVDGERQRDPASRVHVGARVEVDPSGRREGSAGPSGSEPSLILYADRELVVARKPPGLMTVEFDGDDPRETLRGRVTKALTDALKRQGRGRDKRREFVRLGVVSRLDKDTSGVIVFPRTEAARKRLAEQFRAHTTERRYLALVWGRAEAGTHDSWLVEDRGDGRRGSWRGREPKPPAAAKRAVTHTTVEARFEGPWGAVTLLACRLETGRQHQIRIHLSEAGHPLLGDRVYDRRWKDRPIQPERTLLHAAELGFRHPSGGQPLRFEDPPPADFEAVLARLRAEGGGSA